MIQLILQILFSVFLLDDVFLVRLQAFRAGRKRTNVLRARLTELRSDRRLNARTYVARVHVACAYVVGTSRILSERRAM